MKKSKFLPIISCTLISCSLIVPAFVLSSCAKAVYNVELSDQTSQDITIDNTKAVADTDFVTYLHTVDTKYITISRITIGNLILTQDNQYTFDDTTGKLTIIAEAVKTDIIIIAISQPKPTPGPETFKIFYNYQKADDFKKVIVESQELPTVNKDYKSTLKFKDGWWSEYSLIDIQSIKIKNKTLTKDTEYKYEWINPGIFRQYYGELTIYKEQIVGDIVVTLVVS